MPNPVNPRASHILGKHDHWAKPQSQFIPLKYYRMPKSFPKIHHKLPGIIDWPLFFYFCFLLKSEYNSSLKARIDLGLKKPRPQYQKDWGSILVFQNTHSASEVCGMSVHSLLISLIPSLCLFGRLSGATVKTTEEILFNHSFLDS